jgi:RimJ/RimL family protein N-acetyltransferase
LALKEQANGMSLPFAQIEKATGRLIGSTRYMNIDRVHHRVEIGCTWIGREWQRTAANTEAKYLLLRHAFETLGCMRVELKTDSLNDKSRAAILRIGAKEEGIFRNHMITSTGRIRHTVYFSVIDSEWPEVKSRLERKLNG